jgi:hypothetical protein
MIGTMTDTLAYIVQKFGLETWRSERMPIEIPNFGRNELADLFRELGFTKGAEIGVERGEYSEVLCKANPDAHIFLVDPWKSYRGYRDHVDQDKLDGFYEFTQKRMAKYDCEIVRLFSMEAVGWHRKPKNMLDFVYLDGNHEFKHFTEDLCEWSKTVRPGGIIAGHDYAATKNQSFNHVIEVLGAYTKAYRVAPWFVLGSKEKREGEIRDNSRSWMWVKT